MWDLQKRIEKLKAGLMIEPGQTTTVAFLALMVMITGLWIGLIAWAALAFLR
jgi:hypothetical protein